MERLRRCLIVFILILSVGVCAYGSYQPQQLITQGGTKKNLTTDLLQQDLLEEILIELKIMNMHLREITEDKFTETDIK